MGGNTKDIPWTSREGKLDAVVPGKDVWDWDAMPGGGIGGGPACDPFPGVKETGV